MFITGQNDTCKSLEKMIALVVASIYEGYEANEADYADLEWKNGKGQRKGLFCTQHKGIVHVDLFEKRKRQHQNNQNRYYVVHFFALP